ncbi:MAG: 16S rRNA processing protein RimM [Syntrophomonadaceae bacterium]|nr:16S rRNA processing protein RimM [Syntrophomonadaceae bacterium]
MNKKKDDEKVNKNNTGKAAQLSGNDDLISIGRIVGTFSFDGTLKVYPLTDFPERFKKMKKIRVERGGKVEEFAVEEARPHKELYLLKLKGVDSMEKAAEYKHAPIVIGQDELMPLPEGEYYHFQLEGLQVIDEERGVLGVLTEVLATGANDVYVVQSSRYGEVLIPVIKDVISGIDLEAGEMKVRLLPGLVED